MKNSKQPKTSRKARHWTRSFAGGATLAFVGTGAALAAGSSASRLLMLLLGLFAFLASAGTTLYLAASDTNKAGWANILSKDVAESDEVLVVADVVVDEEPATPAEQSVAVEGDGEDDTVTTASTKTSQTMDLAGLSTGSSDGLLLSSDYEGGSGLGGLGGGGGGGSGFGGGGGGGSSGGGAVGGGGGGSGGGGSGGGGGVPFTGGGGGGGSPSVGSAPSGSSEPQVANTPGGSSDPGDTSTSGDPDGTGDSNGSEEPDGNGGDGTTDTSGGSNDGDGTGDSGGTGNSGGSGNSGGTTDSGSGDGDGSDGQNTGGGDGDGDGGSIGGIDLGNYIDDYLKWLEEQGVDASEGWTNPDDSGTGGDTTQTASNDGGSGGSDGSGTGGSDTDGSDTGSSDTGGSDTGGSDTGSSGAGGSETANSSAGDSGTGDSGTGDSGTGGTESDNSGSGGGSISGFESVLSSYLDRLLSMPPEELAALGIRTVNDADGNTNLVVEGEVLKGTGLVTGDLVVDGGTVAPGNSPGTQVTNNLIFNDGVLEIEIAGLNDGDFDLIQVIKDALDPDNTGIATFIDGIVRFVFLDEFAPEAGDAITFLTTEGGIVGWENMVLEIGALADGFLYRIDNDGFNLTFVAESNAVFVPEPGTLTLLLFGAGGLLALRRRRRRD